MDRTYCTVSDINNAVSLATTKELADQNDGMLFKYAIDHAVFVFTGELSEVNAEDFKSIVESTLAPMTVQIHPSDKLDKLADDVTSGL